MSWQLPQPVEEFIVNTASSAIVNTGKFLAKKVYDYAIMPGLRSFRRKQRLGLLVKAPYVAAKPKFLMRARPGYTRSSGFYGRFRSNGSGMKPELKFFDNAISFTADSTIEVPATGQLLTIAQGDTQSNRDGRKIVVKSIYYTGTAVFAPAAEATAAAELSMWLVQDTQCNGAAATVSDDNSGIFTSSAAVPANAVRCLANSDRFKILKKWHLNFNAQAGVTTAYNNVRKHMAFYKKCNIPIEYDASATTGALTSIRSNNLFLVAGMTASDDTIVVSGTCRIRFVG